MVFHQVCSIFRGNFLWYFFISTHRIKHLADEIDFITQPIRFSSADTTPLSKWQWQSVTVNMISCFSSAEVWQRLSFSLTFVYFLPKEPKTCWKTDFGEVIFNDKVWWLPYVPSATKNNNNLSYGWSRSL